MTVQEIIKLRPADRDTIVAPENIVGPEQIKLAYANSKWLQELYPNGVDEMLESDPR